jgi:hypothetical protein
MKPYLVFCLMLTLVVGSCKNNAAVPSDKNTDNTAIKAPAVVFSDLLGTYFGDFGENKITVLISNITGDKAEGKTITGNNEMPFEGTIKEENGRVLVAAHEVGNANSNGFFQFNFDPANKEVLSGNWKPYKTDAGIASKSFILNKKKFIYRKDAGDYPEASMKVLKDDDVNNLLNPELLQMRNEIFARHGYSFSDKEIRDQFADKDWYMPYSTNVSKDLTAIEKKNLALIKRFESYSNQHGDDFGR